MDGARSGTGQPLDSSNPGDDDRDALRRSTRVYEAGQLRYSLWQMANSFLPFFVLSDGVQDAILGLG